MSSAHPLLPLPSRRPLGVGFPQNSIPDYQLLHRDPASPVPTANPRRTREGVRSQCGNALWGVATGALG